MFLIKRKTNAVTSKRSSRRSADLARMASIPLPQQASASPMPEGVTDPNYQPLPGRLGNLTVIQLHGLEKLRKELQEEGAFVPERMDDAMLLRWVVVFFFRVGGHPPDGRIRFLRARKFDHVKTKEMLLDAEKWRKEFGVDDIVKCVFIQRKGVLTDGSPGTLTLRKKKKWINIIRSITTKPTRFFSSPLNV